MKTQEMLFLGIKGYVLALRRDSGQQLWETKVGSGFVNVVMEGDRLYSLCQGEICCLDPLTGKQLWKNPLRGYGLGLATIAFDRGSHSSSLIAQAQQIENDRQTAAGAAMVPAITTAG